MATKLIHFYNAGPLERLRSSGRAHWATGWSRVLSATSEGCQPWVTKPQAYAEARSEGAKARFHETLKEAQQAIKESNHA